MISVEKQNGEEKRKVDEKVRRVPIYTDDFVCTIEIGQGVLHWWRSYLDPFYLSLCRLGRVLVFLSSFSDLLGRKEEPYAKKEEQVVGLESVL